MYVIGAALILVLCTLATFFGMVRYAPTHAENLLKNQSRSSILDYLERYPGASISELCRSNGLPWGTAQHHLYLLRRAGLVRSVMHGRTHMFFRPDIDEKILAAVTILRHSRAQEIARTVLETPGQRQKAICLQLGVTRKVFRHHVDLLTAANLITETKVGKSRLYHPSPTLVQLPRQLAAPAVPVGEALEAMPSGVALALEKSP